MPLALRMAPQALRMAQAEIGSINRGRETYMRRAEEGLNHLDDRMNRSITEPKKMEQNMHALAECIQKLEDAGGGKTQSEGWRLAHVVLGN